MWKHISGEAVKKSRIYDFHENETENKKLF